MIKRNIIYMKGGKEVHIQNINPNVIQKKKKKEYKSKDAQNSLLQTLESATPQKEKKEVIIKQLWNKNQEKRNVI